jgi:hypothetical protein
MQLIIVLLSVKMKHINTCKACKDRAEIKLYASPLVKPQHEKLAKNANEQGQEQLAKEKERNSSLLPLIL